MPPLTTMSSEPPAQQPRTDTLRGNAATVSVIIRTKNRPHLLCEAIASVAAQTYRNIELVVVNDGGDEVEAVVTEYATGSIQQVVYKSLQPGRGRAAAANAGLDLASGKYLMFLDDDDLIEFTHIQNLIESATQNNAKFVYSATKVIQLGQDEPDNEVAEYNFTYSYDRLLFENFIPIHSALFNTELIDNGTRFDTSFDLFEDWDFWLQLSQKTEFMHHPKVSAIYRLHNKASGVHQHSESENSYFKIYKKWLSTYSIETIFSLLQKSHEWIDDKISALQDSNNKKLDTIGRLHSYAQQIVQERDTQLRELNDKLNEIGRKHSYAQQIVQERDAQLQELSSLYNHAIEVINERDCELAKIKDIALLTITGNQSHEHD